MSETTDTLIEYPCDFPIKVMGIAHERLLVEIIELAVLHDPEFNEQKLAQRASGKGTYLGLTLTIRATSREQLDNLYRALSGHHLVKMVL